MRFAVLGPVRAWRGDAELKLGPPKRQVVLALLLIRAGHPVTAHEIIDVLWGQNPPDSAVNVVQRHIGELRRLFEPDLPSRDASRWLKRGSGGYRLDVGAEGLDLLHFRSLRQQARRLADDGCVIEATKLLIEALELWRGPTASGIPTDVRSHPVFAAVDAEHLATVKEAAEYALRAGPRLGARVLVTLRQATAHHPLDEMLQSKLILVLAATGHQAEALDVYRAVRTRLTEDLGVEPGPELHAAQQQVLRHTVSAPPAEPALPAGVTAEVIDARDTPPGTAAELRPAQLPADLATFSGRRSELDAFGALVPAEDGKPPTSMVSVIGGMAGVGKTALAVHWAHQVADSFPDGQLYVDLRGFHPSGSVMNAGEAIRLFLDALGVPSHRIPSGLDAQSALYRSLLADRRMLIVLDNARDSEHVRPLLPGAAGCLVIVTSRSQLYGLVAGGGAHSVTLDLLDEAESLDFLSQRLGRNRIMREPDAAADIVALCGHLPLALAVVSARAGMNPTFPLASIVAELRESQGSLDAFSGEAPIADARSAFFWSYRLLTPEAARVFRLLGLHPGSDCSLAAVASLAGQEPRRIRPVMTELVRANLVSEHTPGRFSCHELLRAYGAELVRDHGVADERRTARRRMLEHYLHTAHAADSVLAPGRERVELHPHATGVTVLQFADAAEAVEWLEANRPALLSAIEQDARCGDGRYSWQLAVLLETYLERNGRWQEQLVVQTTATTTSQRLGDIRGQAHAHRALGFANGRLKRWDEAAEHLTRAQHLFVELADPIGQARVHRYFAYLANQQCRYKAALERYAQACRLYRAADRPSGEASVYNEIGWTFILMGNYDEALDACRRAITLHRDASERHGEAAAWDSLGYAYHHLQDHVRAIRCYDRALRLYREIRDRYLEADTLVHMGTTHHAAGHRARATLAWSQALSILQVIGHPRVVQVREMLFRHAAAGDADTERLGA
ncbi:AfsR/SARP family transcriptional regulator [Streptomyces thermoviolaceus]|uniref:Tetratricopeptide repeat protein n=1 Tax=Streptomyces thermoviolaceus subsp. thermoviolaceus TaxID=66860 RepID=A0ABX0YY00_STRTL|nr:BTAD domain-containing putative transcriptional regulator [Streptomyces thermoviolaceus]NJP17537.1 tetratricopeptide repeat protein [Streptomyces thermoviolaceus subsp. thermoviolaceus]WTD50897.1 tetratricopeptide repeat protein [Streptomyces thermoviolaceus]